jgi:hypothetical protein
MGVADNPLGFRPENSGARIFEGLEAASQSFVRGDMLILNSGKLQIALAASTELVGVAAEDATGTTDTKLKYWGDPDEIFIGRTDAADAWALGAAGDIIGAAGAMQIDANGASTNVLRNMGEVDYDQADAAGKEYRCAIRLHALAEVSS